MDTINLEEKYMRWVFNELINKTCKGIDTPMWLGVSLIANVK